MAYITVKIPRTAVPKIHELQAEYMLEEGRRVSQAEVIEKALEELRHRPKKSRKKKYTLDDLVGSIKGGPRTNSAKDIDDVLYGPMEAP